MSILCRYFPPVDALLADAIEHISPTSLAPLRARRPTGGRNSCQQARTVGNEELISLSVRHKQADTPSTLPKHRISHAYHGISHAYHVISLAITSGARLILISPTRTRSPPLMAFICHLLSFIAPSPSRTAARRFQVSQPRETTTYVLSRRTLRTSSRGCRELQERTLPYEGIYISEVRAKKPSLTLNPGTNGLEVISELPPIAGQTGCLQGKDRTLNGHPSKQQLNVA
ncbi:hypothetical protein J6590_030806 [Homalodisca vitripennis]|nr:hypothetical protein J6590_030806 [Homalodisca vitripennis]